MAVSGADVEKIKEGIGYGIPPKNAENLVATGFGGKAQLSWTIGDTEINGQVICTLKGCIIRKKQGSAPQSLEDGTLVASLNREQAMSYSEIPYEDPQSIGTSSDWYYRLFFYSDHDVFNLDERNIVKVRGTTRAKIWGFRQDFNNLNPDSQISYIEDASGFTPANHTLNTPTNGSWDNWEWMQGNLPYIVNMKTGYALEPVNPQNMNLLQTGENVRADGLTSGLFAWIPKIYISETYVNQNVREVRFATTNRDPRTKNFYLPKIFKNKKGEEIEGLWVPYAPLSIIRRGDDSESYTKHTLRYAIHRGIQSNAYCSIRNLTGTTLSIIKNDLYELFGDNTILLGIDFFYLFRDIFYMLYKTPNSAKGYGKGALTSYERDQYKTSTSAPSANNRLNGRFQSGDWALYTKVFNGLVGTSIIDPYVKFKHNPYGAECFISEYPNFNFDSMDFMGYTKYNSFPSGNGYAIGLQYLEKFMHLSLPNNKANVGESIGLCSAITISSQNALLTHGSIRNYSSDASNNFMNCSFGQIYDNFYYHATLLPTVIPPIEYKPK